LPLIEIDATETIAVIALTAGSHPQGPGSLAPSPPNGNTAATSAG
jgi:hypothetical protein